MKTFMLAIILMSCSGFAAAEDRYIRIDTPSESDSIDPTKPIPVSGSGKGLFEGNVVVRIEDMEGRTLAQVPTTMRREDIAAEGPWQTQITIPATAPDEIRLIAFSPSPKEDDTAITSKPIVLKTTGPRPENIDWQLRQYLSETGEMTPVLPKTTVDARFSDGQISGSAGCNRYFGSYSTAQDNHLTLASEIGSTRMACPPAISLQEQRYFALLPLVNTWQRHDESLLLLDKYRHPLLKYAVAEPTGLEGSPWQATGINNGRGGVVSSKTTHLTTALFENDKISGNAGCNDFTAAYEIKGKQIIIGRAATTRKHCVEPDGIMEQEQQYLHALARARTYALKPGRLELRDENGALQVSYRVHKN
jgi:heat shock protein HslJ